MVSTSRSSNSLPKSTTAATRKKSTSSSAKKLKTSSKPTVTQSEDEDPINFTQQSTIVLQLQCFQEKLSQALAAIKSGVPTKPIHPALSHVLIAVKDDRLTLTVSDLAQTLKADIEAHIINSGAIAVPMDVFSEIVSKSPTGSLSITGWCQTLPQTGKEKQEKRYWIAIEDAQFGKAEIAGLAPTDFPTIDIPDANAVTLPPKVAQVALKGTLFAASTDEKRTILTHVQWQLDRRTQRLQCNACDGAQIATVSLSFQGIGRASRAATSDPITCLIPIRSAKKLCQMLDKVDASDKLLFSYANHRATFEIQTETSTQYLICQCSVDPYPNLAELLNAFQFTDRLVTASKELLTKLDRLSPFAEREIGVQWKFAPQAQQVELSIERQNGKGVQTITGEVASALAGKTAKFSVRYLSDAIRALPSSSVEFTFCDRPGAPVRLSTAGTDELPEVDIQATYFVMPLQSQE